QLNGMDSCGPLAAVLRCGRWVAYNPYTDSSVDLRALNAEDLTAAAANGASGVGEQKQDGGPTEAVRHALRLLEAINGHEHASDQESSSNGSDSSSSSGDDGSGAGSNDDMDSLPSII